MAKKDPYTLKLSPEFVKEFNKLPAKAQAKTLRVIKKLMEDPYQGQPVKNKGPEVVELEHIADEKDFPKSTIAEG